MGDNFKLFFDILKDLHKAGVLDEDVLRLKSENLYNFLKSK